MNDTIRTIDELLDDFEGQNVAAIKYPQGTDLPTEAELVFNRGDDSTFTFDFEGDRFQYVAIDEGGTDEIKQYMDNADWGDLILDGENHLEGMRRKVKNQQRKQRRRGLR